MMRAGLSDNGATLTVDIPLRIRRRGGRKVMLAPRRERVGAPALARGQRYGEGDRSRVPLAGYA